MERGKLRETVLLLIFMKFIRFKRIKEINKNLKEQIGVIVFTIRCIDEVHIDNLIENSVHGAILL